MKKAKIILFACILYGLPAGIRAQTNMFIANPVAVEVLKGNYDPNLYRPAEVVDQPDSIRMGIIRNVSPQEQVDLLNHLETFHNRNSGSDTLSNTTGIGACRTWIRSYFDQASKDNGGRLVTGYLEFDADICGMSHHKNPFALLPGLDTTNHEIIVIEGHFDTRNEGGCDTEGYTPGIDDNGSGTVLVMELARVMSRYAFNQTILFTTPTGEDEGLWGSKAWSGYLKGMDIKIRSVLNNDIVGGIYCGKTSPAPSCPYYGHVDSTHVRIFSYSSANSMFTNSSHKQLARYMKYVQDELINPYLSTPMSIRIMIGEDRSGRGGDQTPFRQKGYTSVRIISANEHGNGTGTPPDRNHSVRDVLGQDVDGDGILDSLFVNPGYLSRNTILSGVVAGLLASAPEKMAPTVEPVQAGAVIRPGEDYDRADAYLVGVRKYRSRSLEFDTLYLVNPSAEIIVPLESGQHNYVSIAPVRNGAPGLFSNEYDLNLTGTGPQEPHTGFHLYQNYPNPWSDQTTIRVTTPESFLYRSAVLQVRDMIGRIVLEEEVYIESDETLIPLKASQLSPGLFTYSLVSGGNITQTALMLKK